MTLDKSYFVYILASKKRGTLYTGFSGGLPVRVYQHKMGETQGFTSLYKVKRLVYYEHYNDPETAIRREKQIKKWNRAWKIRLIEQHNPDWNELYVNGEIRALPKE
ncbi:MAG: GIY-YIG nuclease family protein [Ignavibacteriae bacterium]|nr:GIY-YIG nuclease family protein [Ignavibacteriota bacterium]